MSLKYKSGINIKSGKVGTPKKIPPLKQPKGGKMPGFKPKTTAPAKQKVGEPTVK